MKWFPILIMLTLTLLLVACERVSPFSEDTPTATVRPTASPVPGRASTVSPTITESAEASKSSFTRTAAWFEATRDGYPTDEQMTQLVDAFAADTIAYLERGINPEMSLKDQQAALVQMTADLPGLEGGGVIPVDLDQAVQTELFIVPKLNGGPLLYTRYVDESWQAIPVPVSLPGESRAVAVAPNMWPASAEVRDVTGDRRQEVLITHTVSGGSNWTEHLQVLRWNGTGFDILFRAGLVNWVGRSTWELEPNPAGGQDIVLRYPYFYLTGFEAKMIAHPWATQRWRWNPSLEQYTLQETTRDLESVLDYDHEGAEWEYLRVLVNEAELHYQASDLEGALERYQAVVARAADIERPTERTSNWPAYARFRAAQVQALLGRVDETRSELRVLLANLDEDSNLRPLAQTFDAVYDPAQPDAALRAMAALHRLRLYEQFYWHDDRPGDLTFPMNMATLLWPGTPLACYLDAHQESVDGSPSPERERALLRALSELGFPVTHVRIADINADGLPEVLVTTDETDQPNGRRSVWLLAQVSDRWQSCRQPNDHFGLSEVLTEYPLPDGRIILRKGESAFTWTGEALVEVDLETYEPLPPPWPRVGGF